ncbi:MAG: GTP 3',8-cyclase MoaA [Caulobacteraceae bacterium]|nr:GTP 3',8-cyclase MoaA [Caulobacter sp.]
MTPYDAASVLATPLRVGAPAPLADGLGRTVRYLRVSVTDRCDLRCLYCMPQHMRFLPKPEVLSLEEIERLCAVFIRLGARKLRLTGGEPLVRRDVIQLFERLGRHLRTGGLDELTLTTNGTRLAEFAAPLRAAGVRRVNVSLDTLDPDAFHRTTRGGDLARVLAGIEAAQATGLQVKINAVALAHDNRAELPSLVGWAHGRGLDVTLIEAMPMGEVDQDRTDQFVSLQEVKRDLAAVWTLTPLPESTGGPARYMRVEETGGRIGFITPLSHTFCDTCNRVRLTCTGVLHTCLGQDDATDLRGPLRAGASDAELEAAIRGGLMTKPRGHDFSIAHRGQAPSQARHMSTTGG